MTPETLALAFLRATISVAAFETAIRYSIWRYMMRSWDESFRQIITVVAGLTSALFIFSLYGLLYARMVPGTLAGKIVLFGGDLEVLATLFMALWVCFEISCDMSRWRIVIELLSRFLLGALVTAVIHAS